MSAYYLFSNLFILIVLSSNANCLYNKNTLYDTINKPLYNYHYQTQGVLESDAATLPYRGYRVIESSYYPSNDVQLQFNPAYHRDNQYLNIVPFDLQAPSIPINDYTYEPYASSVYRRNGGDSISNRQIYASDNRNINDLVHQRLTDNKGQQIDHDREGYNKAVAVLKNNRADYGQFNDQSHGKQLYEDTKQSDGGQQFHQSGKNAEELNRQSGHKKGHLVKGFKTSHHKDESGKTEEFYDEADDIGDRNNYNNARGSFNSGGVDSYRNGYDNGNFVIGGHQKASNYDNEHAIDNSHTNHGKYGERRYTDVDGRYVHNNGGDQRSFLNQQNANRLYGAYPHRTPIY